MPFDYDLFVIGAGSGGVRAARLAAKAGARVAIAEQAEIGGTCVIRGCVPKKLLVYGAEYAQAFRDAAGFGWSPGQPAFDWGKLRDAVQGEVQRLSGLYRGNLEAAGAKLVEERATVAGANAIKLGGGGEVSAERILIATGGRPVRPAGVSGQEHGIVSDDAFLLERLPERMLIAGGGYIALEFANIFSGLGVDVTVAHRGERILRGFDDDVRLHVQNEMQRSGVNIVCGVNVASIELLGSGVKRAALDDGSHCDAEQIMWAIGRAPSTEGLGLETAGVRLTQKGAAAVDEYSRTAAPSIWAVGDVTDRINLTPVAIREAQAFVATEFLKQPTRFDHADVASAVFSRPAVGAVGLTEARAREQGHRLRVFRTTFRPMKHILAGNQQRVLMKLVVGAADDRVLGVHIAGPDAPELIQLAAVAVKAGLTKAQWDAACAVHPTGAEELVLMGEPIAHDNEAPA